MKNIQGKFYEDKGYSINSELFQNSILKGFIWLLKSEKICETHSWIVLINCFYESVV